MFWDVDSTNQRTVPKKSEAIPKIKNQLKFVSSQSKLVFSLYLSWTLEEGSSARGCTSTLPSKYPLCPISEINIFSSFRCVFLVSDIYLMEISHLTRTRLGCQLAPLTHLSIHHQKSSSDSPLQANTAISERESQRWKAVSKSGK